MNWIRESPPFWNEDMARIVGAAPAGVFDRRFGELERGERVPGEWWRVEEDGATVGYGWLDVVWGDAEILLATAPGATARGVGSFIVEELVSEANKRGLSRVYNWVRPTHPDREAVTAWLMRRGFQPSEDGSLVREVARGE